uniref:FBD domain-containing protein n=1 Tax=Leersia perrieri TaxID=77586 RepID=A0A0D9XZR5_9ORYZ
MEPPSICCLYNLQTLCGVLVSNDQIAREFSELTCLRKLQIELKAWNPILSKACYILLSRLEDYFPGCITSITLSASRIETDQLKILGESRCLWELKLKDDAFLLSELSCPRNSFPELRYFKISSLTNLEACQIETGALQNLVRFSIHNCSKFRSTIDVLEHATRLQVLKLKGIELLPDIADSCRNKNVSVITKT